MSKAVIEVAETFIEANRPFGAQPTPKREPREWYLFCRKVGKRGEGKHFIQTIAAPNYRLAVECLKEFLRGKKVVADW